MSRLLSRWQQPNAEGRTQSVTPERAGWGYVGFEAYELQEGQQLTLPAVSEERCLVLIYSGANAVEKIRKILGPTDPSKAEPGSVRKEYGQSIMVNAAHASDSPDNAKREMGIVKPEKDTIKAFVDQYYPA